MTEKRVLDELEILADFVGRTLEAFLEKIDRVKDPVWYDLIDAYSARMDAFYQAGGAGVPKELRLLEDLKELHPWLFTEKEVGLKAAHDTPLGERLHQIGYEHSMIVELIEAWRNGKRGRPREAALAIEALQLKLHGRQLNEIAEILFGDDREACERTRKLIESIEPIYNKYKPRT
jgi:hypothetical protein